MTWMTRFGVLLVVVSLALSAAASEPPITAIAIAPGGEQIVTASGASLRVYDGALLDQKQAFAPELPRVHALAFSPDGKRLAVGGGAPAVQGRVQILDWPSGKSIAVLGEQDDVVMSVGWLDSDRIAMAAMDGTIEVWNAGQRRKERTLEGHSRGILSLVVVGPSRRLVSAGVDRSLRVWDSATGKLQHSITIHTGTVNAMAIRPQAPTLPMVASAGDDRTVRFWQPSIGRMVRFVRLDSRPLDLAWLPDGTRVVASCVDGTLVMIDPDTVETSEPIHAGKDWIHAVEVDTLGQRAVVGHGGRPTWVTLPPW